MKKGLIGAVKYSILLGAVILAIFFIAMPGFADTPSADVGPKLWENFSSVSSGGQYAPIINYGFQVNVSNSTSTTIPGTYNNVSNCTFATNLTTGTVVAQNFTKLNSSFFTTFTNNSDGIWWINFTQEQIAGAGNYVYYWGCNLTNASTQYTDWNYTQNITYSIIQNTTTSSWMNLTIDDTEANATQTYSFNTANTTGNYTSAAFPEQTITFTLYRDTTNTIGTKNGENETDIWGVGQTYYDYNTSGNVNYSSAAKHYHINITQNTSTADLINMTLGKSTSGTQANYSATYAPENINVTGNYTGTDFTENTITFTLIRNLVSVGASNPISDTAKLGAGSWNYTYYTAGNTNFSATTLHYNATISQNTSVYPQITNATLINKTHTVTWFWANVTTDLEFPTYNADTSWCGVSVDNATNVSLTNATGNWYANLSGPYADGPHNLTYYCNNTNTNYTVNTNHTGPFNLTFGATIPVLSGGAASGYTTSLTATISLTTNEDATCRYSTSANTAYGTMSSALTTTSGRSHSWTVSASAYATYNYYIRCNDTYGTLNIVDYPINFTKSAETSTTSGGSSGVAVEQTVEITSILAGETKTMTFTDDDLDIPKVDITAKNDMFNVALKITKLDTLPSNLDAPAGVVYKYLNFAQTRMEEEDIDNVKIRFRVTKSWIEFNEIDPSTIVMKRWNDDKWNRLSTKSVSDDSTYYTYEATTSGFSYFIIEGTQYASDEEPTITETIEEIVESDNTWLWIIVILVIIGVAGYYYHENFYKKKTPWKSLHKKWRR